jgi:outer membrane cobalamin receptor
MLSTSVFAQEQRSETADDLVLEEVVVTGSRIVTEDGFGRTSPVAVVDMESISEFGFTRVEDILNNLPQVEMSQTAFLSNGSTGTATVNLRGLGANRTLVANFSTVTYSIATSSSPASGGSTSG